MNEESLPAVKAYWCSKPQLLFCIMLAQNVRC